MDGRFFALLVYDRPSPLEPLELVLRDMSVETCSVRTCEEVERLIAQTQPHFVFTDTSLPDGSWVDIINLAEKATVPFNVIVVGANQDIKLYVSALERGAFDFLLPPFERAALDHILRSAGQDVLVRRQTPARAAVA